MAEPRVRNEFVHGASEVRWFAPLSIAGFGREFWRVNALARHLRRLSRSDGGSVPVLIAREEKVTPPRVEPLPWTVVAIGRTQRRLERLMNVFTDGRSGELMAHLRSVLGYEAARSLHLDLERWDWGRFDPVLDSAARNLAACFPAHQPLQRAVRAYWADKAGVKPRNIRVPRCAGYHALGW